MSAIVILEKRTKVSRGNYANMFSIHGTQAVWKLPSVLKILCYFFPFLFGIGKLENENNIKLANVTVNYQIYLSLIVHMDIVSSSA